MPIVATPSGNPPSGSYLLYFKSDGVLYKKDSTGTESAVSSGSASGAPLSTTVTNASANSVYPDATSYWKHVATTDGFPVGGMLSGQRSGATHTQRLQDEATGNTYARYWINASTAWSAWALYLDAQDFTAKGDMLAASGSDASTVVPVGADGTNLTADSTQAAGLAYTFPLVTSAGVAPTNPPPGKLWYDTSDSMGNVAAGNPDGVEFVPTGLFRITIPRTQSGWSTTLASLISGRLTMQSIWLNAGETVSSIMFMSSGTGAGTPTNWWFALYGTDGVTLLGQTADQLATAWGVSTVKQLALTSAYKVTQSGYYYLGVMVKATTVPTLFGFSINVNITGITPVVEGTSTTGLTTTAPNPALAPTRAGNVLLAGVG